MNPKSIFKLFSPKEKAQAVVHQGVSALIISSVALSLIALTACVQVVPASEPVAAVAPAQAAASEQHRIEALPNIDPADRKFFSPGYGAISGVAKEAEGLPMAGVEPHTLAWPPRPTQFRMADNAVTSLDETALAAYHQSEWGRIPNVTLPVGENTLAAYHQSEWGRTLSTGLPIAKNETDSNQDIGLMEFFTIPDETSRQRTEPGTLEALPNIDPADRKFFSPSYGVQGVSANRHEAVLPTIENERGNQIPIWFLLK